MAKSCIKQIVPSFSIVLNLCPLILPVSHHSSLFLFPLLLLACPCLCGLAKYLPQLFWDYFWMLPNVAASEEMLHIVYCTILDQAFVAENALFNF